MTDTEATVMPKPKSRWEYLIDTGARLGGAFIIVMALLWGMFEYFSTQQSLDHEMRMKMLDMVEQVQ